MQEKERVHLCLQLYKPPGWKATVPEMLRNKQKHYYNKDHFGHILNPRHRRYKSEEKTND